MPAVVVALGDSPLIRSAQEECVRGIRGMLGRTLRAESQVPKENSIILGNYEDVLKSVPSIGKMSDLGDDGYWIRNVEVEGAKHLIVAGTNERGVLYGTFALLRKIALHQPILELNEQQAPAIPIRLAIQRDRLDGTTTEGYSGLSLIWDAGRFTSSPERVRDLARLLASVGINAIALNDPADAQTLLATAGSAELAKAADAFRPWGLRIVVAIDVDALIPPMGESQSSAADPATIAALAKSIDQIFSAVPDLAGFVVSEVPAPPPAVPAPSAAEDPSPNEAAAEPVPVVAESPVAAEPAQPGANVAKVQAIADAIAARGAVVIFRPKAASSGTDVAPTNSPASGFEALRSLDAQLPSNVMIDIPALPVSANLRQPPSPLIGALTKATVALNFDLKQSHFGQQRHLVFLAPIWRTLLDFDLKASDKPTPVKSLVRRVAQQAASPSTPDAQPPAPSPQPSPLPPSSAFVAEINLGRDPYWLRDPLAMANLFAFGRLSWDPELAPKVIAEEWARLTFGHDPLVVGTVVDALLDSAQHFENYTGPIGLGVLSSGAPPGLGPDVESARQFRLLIDEQGVGVDRTVASGNKLLGLYRPDVGGIYESLESCPDELVLFMHHVPYTHRLKSGKSVIQHVYNSLYAGAEGATRMADKWRALDGKIDEPRYRAILAQLDYQAGHAQAWRDAIANWFLRTSGIADEEGRVGTYPGRFEAEAMQLDGYEAKDISPWETASGGKCAENIAPTGTGSLSFKYEGEPGWADVSIRYFDENDGVARYELHVAGEMVDQWHSDAALPGDRPNGHTTSRHITRSIALRKGDEIRLATTAEGAERAAVDYIEIQTVKP